MAIFALWVVTSVGVIFSISDRAVIVQVMLCVCGTMLYAAHNICMAISYASIRGNANGQPKA